MTDISMTNTKKEILEAYNQALEKITNLENKLLKPEKKIEEKKEQSLIVQAKKIVDDNLEKTFGNLKSHLDTVLSEAFGKIDEQVKKYQTMEEVISFKEKELQEIYEIEKTSYTLAALIEAQNEKSTNYESEMEELKKTLEQEIEILRNTIAQEKVDYENEIKDIKERDKINRERENEEFKYNFKREKIMAENKLNDELDLKRREFETKIEQKQKELETRGNSIKTNENELFDLRKRVDSFDENQAAAVEKAKTETTERVKLSLKHELELTEKQYAGEKEVLLTKISALELKVKEQSDMIKSVSNKLESSYEKVQNVAVKAIEGASKSNYQGMKEVMSERKDEK